MGGDEDGIVVHDAEDGDESYPDGDAEVAAKQVLEPDAARNGRRNPGKEDEHRLRKGFECHEDQDEADEHGQGDKDLQSLSCPDLVFKLAAPLDIVAVRQHDLLRYDFGRLFHKAHQAHPRTVMRKYARSRASLLLINEVALCYESRLEKECKESMKS